MPNTLPWNPKMTFNKVLISLSAMALMFAGNIPLAHAQSVGSRVEVNPLGLPDKWLPATVVRVHDGGATVLVDQREGYAPNEQYFVAKKWMREASNAAAAPSVGVGSTAGDKSALAAGQRVKANYIYVGKDEFWKSGVISRIVSPGVYAIHFDDGKDLICKSDWVRTSTEPMPVFAGAANAKTASTNGIAYAAPTAHTATQPAPHQSEKHVAGKGTPPDGLYQCNMLSGGMYIHIGTLEIRGNTYRAFNKNSGFHSFTVDGSGNMNFSAGLSGMPDGFKLTSCGYVGSDHAGRPLIKIRYVGASNAHDTIDAVRE